MSERTVRHRDDGPSKYLGEVRTVPGDERDVDPDTAAYLVGHTGYFEYADAGADADAGELCGAEMSDGSTCERPVEECPYESHRE